jgi:hypothetical protein
MLPVMNFISLATPLKGSMPIGPGGGDMEPFANMCFAAWTAAATPPCWSLLEALYWRRAELWRSREGTGRKHAGHWRVEMAERV